MQSFKAKTKGESMAYDERRGKRGFGGGRGGFGGGFRFERKEPAPVKAGEEHDVVISEVSTRGDGITRIRNFIIFVPNTRKGDKVRIRIKEVRGRHAIGEVIPGPSEGPEAEEPAEAPPEETAEK